MNRTTILALLAMTAIPVSAFAQNTPQPAAIEQPTSQSIELSPQIIMQDVQVELLPEKGVMQLRFSVANKSNADTTLMAHNLAFAYGLRDVGLIDFAGRKRYGMGFANGCLCSSFPERDGGVIRAGETRNFWAWFALPKDRPSHVAVQFPDRQPIMNVPVQ